MGLFSINYNKPGPGVSKDAPVKKPFFRFWEVYFRKFFDLIKVNLLFAIPTIIFVAVSLTSLFKFGNSIFSVNPNLIFLFFFPMIFLSPFVAGLTFVCRNYAREEHAFILSDFWDAVKNNWKQSLANGIICYIFFVLMSISIPFYSTQLSSNSLLYIPFVVCCIISFLFICAQFYIPVMIITFDLSLKQIYKNALIFSIVGLWRNLMLIAILAVFIIAAIIFFLMIPALAIFVLFVLAVFWMFGFFGFLINFAVYPMIVKFIITPYEKAQQEKKKAEAGESTEEEEDEPDFQDSLY